MRSNRQVFSNIGKAFYSLSAKQLSNPNVQLTSLSNGVRVVTDCTPGHFSALGAYVDGGSRFEDPERPGISHIVDRMAWKSTEKFSGVEMMDRLSKLGGNYMCSAQRESMIYQASVFNKDLEQMFECIAQTIRAPRITELELNESLQTAEYEGTEISLKPELAIPEELHAAAYEKNTLGLPLFCPIERIPSVTLQEVKDYHKKFYQPQNITLAMVGVPHEKALRLAQSHFGDWKNELHDRAKLDKVRYTGGEIALPYQPPIAGNLPELYHLQIAFETTGLLDDDLYALALLQKLLGGGSSFSAGGPGKGMFSRLYTRVLNQYGFVENCMCFNHSYVGSGLFGITMSCMPQTAPVMAHIICFELSKLLEKDPSEGGITDSEFDRAKNQLISSLLMNVESKLAALEDMGRQIQCQGTLTTIDEMISKIESLELKDIRSVAEKVLTGETVTSGFSSGRPTVAVQGNREEFGDIEFVLQQFGLGKLQGKPLSKPREFGGGIRSKFSRWF